MKNSLLKLLLCSIILIITGSCQQAYQPMSQDEIDMKVDSIYNASKGKYVKDLKASCDSALDSKVKVRAKELSN